MDNVISQAQATLGALVTQRSTFGGITSKITNVSSRLPTVHFLQTPLIIFLCTSYYWKKMELCMSQPLLVPFLFFFPKEQFHVYQLVTVIMDKSHVYLYTN